MSYEEIGRKIRETRTRKRLTKDEVALIFGVNRSSITNWECGLSARNTETAIAYRKLAAKYAGANVRTGNLLLAFLEDVSEFMSVPLTRVAKATGNGNLAANLKYGRASTISARSLKKLSEYTGMREGFILCDPYFSESSAPTQQEVKFIKWWHKKYDEIEVLKNGLVDLPKQVELDAVIEVIDDIPETFELCHTNQTDVKTMLSTEIVKIINDMREEGAAVLTHDNFMKKIVKVLGEKGAVKFNATYRDSQNKERPCYALPKRESELMVMSESYKVQAAVYDRMTELAEKVIEQTTPQQAVQIAPITAEFESALALARMCGLENNQAVLGANKMVKKMTNVDVLEMLGSPALISPTNERFFNVTTLAMALGKSAISLNRELEQKGFQVKTGDLWTATEKGKPFSVLQDVGKSHSNGTPIQQLKWFESIKAELVD